MKIHRVSIALSLALSSTLGLFLLNPSLSRAGDSAAVPVAPSAAVAQSVASHDELKRVCEARLHKVPGNKAFKEIEKICDQAQQMPVCRSVKGEPIFYYERKGEPEKGKPSQNILVFGLIHGDEENSTAVATAWANRLAAIQPRNTWRVIPVLNPDGWDLKTRTNANAIDVNRNFPSKDFDELAQKYWHEHMHSNARRNPGTMAASEPETRCAMAQIDEFKPDFIISVHTPLGVLDFDGPKVPTPHFGPLPWVSLGNYPGSLGRYMWLDRKVPVLTVELKALRDVTKSFEDFDRLQDITGTVAIQADKLLKKDQKSEKNGVTSTATPTSASASVPAADDEPQSTQK